jgi:hypothetical protein
MKNLIATFLFILGFSFPVEAQQPTEEFYIQQRSTLRFAVPYYGKLQNQNTILMHSSPATPKEKGHFFFEQKEGPWGLIVSAYDKNLCLCPYTNAGWRVSDLIKQSRWENHNFVESNPATGTFIGYSTMKTELCYWRIDQEEDVIIHYNGTYLVAQGTTGEQYPTLVTEGDKNKYGQRAINFIAVRTNNIEKGVIGKELNISGAAKKSITYEGGGSTWIDKPTGEITKIQVMQEGSSITTELAQSIGVSLLKGQDNIQSSITTNKFSSELEVGGEGSIGIFGPKISSKFKLGLSITSQQEITEKVTQQTNKTLEETQKWKISSSCPPTQRGYVRFAISEQVIRVRKNPMSIVIDGEDPIYIQESVPYTKVTFTGEYQIGSPEIKRKWNDFKRDTPNLLSPIEKKEFIDSRN